MLKKFFLNTLSSFLGAWIAIVILGVVAVMMVLGLIAKVGISEYSSQSVTKGSVLVIELEGEIIENEVPADFDYTGLLSGEISKKRTLSEITRAIEAAKENKNIKGIYVKCGAASAAPATYNAIREALLNFKESGKPVIAYGALMMTGPYFVSSVADKIYLNPAGSVAMQGLGGISIFYKNLLDNIGVEVQVAKVGTYKSAVEPYISNTMSEPARAQLDTLYGNMWQYIRDGIASRRDGLTAEKINTLVGKDFIFLKPGDTVLENGLVDGLSYERSLDSIIAASIGIDKDDLNFVNPELLVSQESIAKAYDSKKQIVLLYATGEIVDGGNSSSINYQKLVPLITSLADNENVKGMVLRVNSPGGSAFGSEQIGDALDYFKAKGKPLAVSMGDYAASGGYWISAGADKIFADPLTITGSIGIFGLIPNIDKLMKKIGLNAELVATDPEAQFPNLVKPLNEEQLAAFQQSVSLGYDKFVKRVAMGRHMTEAEVRRIGEGRVWDAETAQKIGLVDELGGVKEAINWVSNEIGTDDYDVSTYPRIESSVWDILPQLMEIKLMAGRMEIFGEHLPARLYFKVNRILTQYPLQAKMPEISVKL